MEQLNDQIAINKMFRHLILQGKKAVDPFSGDCRYRTTDGLKCAVGALIPDELYDPGAECWSIETIFDRPKKYYKLVEYFKDVSPELLSTAQVIHDGNFTEGTEFIRYITGQFDELAETYGLKLDKSVLDEINL